MQRTFDLAFFGHFARDIIEVNGKQVVAAGGGIFYGGVAAITAGARVAVITRYRKEDEPLIAPLREAGATIFPAYAGQTSGIHNIYTDPTMETRTCIPLGFAGTIQASDVPAGLEASYIVISPIIAGEVDMPLLRWLHERFPGKVCLDVQGFVRVREGNDLVFKDWPEKREGMAMITILKCDAAEAKSMTGKETIDDALTEIGSWGPREIVLTHNKGVSLFVAGETKRHFFPWTARSMDGRTGRGDTCFSSYIAMRLRKPPVDALRFAAAITSLKMEVPGPVSRPLEAIERHEREAYPAP